MLRSVLKRSLWLLQGKAWGEGDGKGRTDAGGEGCGCRGGEAEV